MNIVAYSDSDFWGRKESRISVSGFIIILNNKPIRWRSKAQHSVTLSSSEAEYVALSESAKGVKFICISLKSMILEADPAIHTLTAMVHCSPAKGHLPPDPFCAGTP